VPPPKRVKPTEAIFEQLKQANPAADRADDTLRISIDAKATVNIGPFSRRGRSRTKTKAADHDFKPEATLTPFGITLVRKFLTKTMGGAAKPREYERGRYHGHLLAGRPPAVR
jgi:hypothetical protein